MNCYCTRAKNVLTFEFMILPACHSTILYTKIKDFCKKADHYVFVISTYYVNKQQHAKYKSKITDEFDDTNDTVQLPK